MYFIFNNNAVVLYILLLYLGEKWGWILIPPDETHKYICEISRADVYKILEEGRGFGKLFSHLFTVWEFLALKQEPHQD